MTRMIGFVILAALVATHSSASPDPFVGKWKLDIRRSKYPAGTCPTNMLIEMRPAENGIWYRSDATYRTGSEIHAQYTASYDGKQTIVMGGRGMLLPVSLKRIDSRTVVASYLRGFEIIAISRRVVSADGKRMTITTTSRERIGNSVRTVGVYTKENDKH